MTKSGGSGLGGVESGFGGTAVTAAELVAMGGGTSIDCGCGGGRGGC